VNLVARGTLDKMDMEAFARGYEWAIVTTLTIMHAVLEEGQRKTNGMINEVQFYDF
jgi:hypothetical protein